MQTLARFVIRRRWFVIVGWLAFIALAQVVSGAAGGADYKNDFKLPNTEAQTVASLLKQSGLDTQNGATGTIVLHAKSGLLRDQAGTVAPQLAQLCSSDPGLASVTSPFATQVCGQGAAKAGDPALLSKDGTIGLTELQFRDAEVGAGAATSFQDEVKKFASPTLQIELTGSAFQALGEGAGGGGLSPEVIGFLAAFVILALVFRTVGATVLPLVTAIAALGSGLALIALLSHAISVADFATQLATLMVLGVGIDYALFIVTRHRRNLLKGMAIRDSIVLAMDTSGRSVMFAGITVCIAILGLIALQVSFLYGVAIGTALGVALTMAASLTLLPALLTFLGLRILPRKQRKALQGGNLDHEEHHGFWFRWSHLIERRPIVPALAAGAVILAMAVPFFSIRLGSSDQGNDTSAATTRKGYDLIAQGFGAGYNGKLELVVNGPGATDRAYLNKIRTALAQQQGVVGDSISVQPLPGGKVAFVNFTPTTSPQEETTTILVKHLRNDVAPGLEAGTSNQVYVYGVTAVQVDFAKVLQAKMPLFFVAVIGLSFLLLLVAFRSVVIPLTAAAMNLLAAGASFGVVVAIFQWGWGSELLGIGKGGPIEPFIPVMFFAILFGLSMDYQVFLVSRMHEEWTHSHDNRRAITVGQGETGGVITAAALIMIAVFSGFVFGDSRVIKLFGVGLGGAIFIDAFILRTVLVPSVMHMLGRANWWFPAWLEKITPRVSIEPADDASGAQAAREDERLTRV